MFNYVGVALIMKLVLGFSTVNFLCISGVILGFSTVNFLCISGDKRGCVHRHACTVVHL